MVKISRWAQVSAVAVLAAGALVACQPFPRRNSPCSRATRA